MASLHIHTDVIMSSDDHQNEALDYTSQSPSPSKDVTYHLRCPSPSKDDTYHLRRPSPSKTSFILHSVFHGYSSSTLSLTDIHPLHRPLRILTAHAVPYGYSPSRTSLTDTHPLQRPFRLTVHDVSHGVHGKRDRYK